jgi:prephenate dehydrogenase
MWGRLTACGGPPVRPFQIITNVETTAIFGVGLIGGSFALALRAAGYKGRIIGVSSASTITRALERGVIDEGLPPAQAAKADLIFLAQPIGVIIDTIAAIAPHLHKHALVTDAGSTKSAIMTAAAQYIEDGQFIGGHPMAGKEVRGVDAASAELFRGRVWGLTPAHPDHLNQPRTREFLHWLEKILWSSTPPSTTAPSPSPRISPKWPPPPSPPCSPNASTALPHSTDPASPI